MLSRVKKNDLVSVISGKDKGKQGVAISIDPKKDTVLVKGVALLTKHYKARKQGEKSGIISKEALLPTSKVMPVCSSCKKACRVKVKTLEQGKKVRSCHHCGGEF